MRSERVKGENGVKTAIRLKNKTSTSFVDARERIPCHDNYFPLFLMLFDMICFDLIRWEWWCVSGSICLGHGRGGLKAVKIPVPVLSSKKSEEWGHDYGSLRMDLGERVGKEEGEE